MDVPHWIEKENPLCLFYNIIPLVSTSSCCWYDVNNLTPSALQPIDQHWGLLHLIDLGCNADALLPQTLLTSEEFHEHLFEIPHTRFFFFFFVLNSDASAAGINKTLLSMQVQQLHSGRNPELQPSCRGMTENLKISLTSHAKLQFLHFCIEMTVF